MCVKYNSICLKCKHTQNKKKKTNNFSVKFLTFGKYQTVIIKNHIKLECTQKPLKKSKFKNRTHSKNFSVPLGQND